MAKKRFIVTIEADKPRAVLHEALNYYSDIEEFIFKIEYGYVVEEGGGE